MLQKLAGLEEAVITLVLPEKPRQAVTAVEGDIDIYLPLIGLIDLTKEIGRLEKELQKLAGELTRLEGKLNNPAFLAKAPQEVVAEERVKAEGYRLKWEKVNARLENLR